MSGNRQQGLGGGGQPSVSLEGQTLQFPSFLESFSSSSSFAQTGSPVTLVYAAVRWVFRLLCNNTSCIYKAKILVCLDYS